MSAADWLTSDAVTESLASIKRENDKEEFEGWAAEQDFTDPFADSPTGITLPSGGTRLGHQPGCGCH